MRKNAREAVFKIVFATMFHSDCTAGFRGEVYRKEKLTEEDKEFAEKLFGEIQLHREELSGLIAEQVTHFAEYRIYPADKALMLIALTEIKYFGDIPNVVSVNEAVELARKYSTENSADFVNGVLGGFINA